jgi:phage terminase small subunit
MNARQKLFVAAYRKKPNATEAAIAAGYGKSGAKSRGSELLKRPDVQAALKVVEERAAKKARLSEDELLERLEREIETDENGSSDRIAAIKLYGQQIGMFKTNVKHSADESFADMVLAAQRKREGAKK